jgi:hypothetical protein
MIKPNKLCMSIDKDNKIEKTIRWQQRGGTQTSLKIKLRGARVWWPVVFRVRWHDLPRGHAGQLKLNWFDVYDTFLFFTKKYRICGLGCSSRRCQTSAEVERHVDEKTWGNDVGDDSDKTYRPSLLQKKRSTFFVMRSLT